ncbi:MAG: hypothetical protein ACJ71A_00360, partial [Nitrososphaeraceae archaeon]
LAFHMGGIIRSNLSPIPSNPHELGKKYHYFGLHIPNSIKSTLRIGSETPITNNSITISFRERWRRQAFSFTHPPKISLS